MLLELNYHGYRNNPKKEDISSLSIHVVVVQTVQGQQGNLPENAVHVQNCCSTNIIAELSRARLASGEPWVRKFGKLSIRENFVMT